jgi:hypothetical protein
MIFKETEKIYKKFTGKEIKLKREIKGWVNSPQQRYFEEYWENVTSKWVGKDFLGETLAMRAKKSPAIPTAETENFFEALSFLKGGTNRSYGAYYPGTNHVFFDRFAIAAREDRARHVITHEYLHYVSHLGGGGPEIRWLDENNKPVIHPDKVWLHEGLTEMHTQQIYRRNFFGRKPRTPAYVLESLSGFYLQKLVGADVLKKAYLTGDFTKGREDVNQKLGKGTFEGFVNTKRGADALEFLFSKLKSVGIDHKVWHMEWVENRGVS